MELYEFAWKPDIPWIPEVERVLTYYAKNPNLKFGPAKQNKAFTVIGYLCSCTSVSQTDLMERYKLSMDDIMTILSNVTMAIHEKGNILPPSKGGWYATAQSPYTYFVAPGFAVAWNAVHANKG